MKKGRDVILTIALISAFVLMLLPLSSAGFFSDLWGEITGKITNPVSLNITVGAVSVPYVWNNSIPTVTMTIGPNPTNVQVNFTASSGAGFSNINMSSATVNFSRTGETTRINNTCANVTSWGNFANFTCNVTMWWFDASGTWNISAAIKDINGNLATNMTQVFQTGSTTSFSLGPSNLTWSAIAPGATNTTPSNTPILLNNSGNQAAPTGTVSLNATNLLGETTSSLGLWASNFSTSITGYGTPPSECNATASTLISKVAVNITNANLSRGNYTINNNITGQEQLFVCLRLAGTELTSQAYSTLNQGAWIISLL